MKKLFFLGATALVCILFSCKDSTTTSTSTTTSEGETAKANNRAVLKMIETGDMSKLDSFLSKDAVDHSSNNGTGETKGLDSIKMDLAKVKQAFASMHFDVMKEAVDGDYLFVLGKMTGTTSANPGMGMPANKEISSTSVDVLKFKDGKFTEHWSFIDPKDMMKMMDGDHMNMGTDSKMAGDHKMNNKMGDSTHH